MNTTSIFTRSKLIPLLLALTVLLTPAVRVVREPPKDVALTVRGNAGLNAPNLADLEGTPALDPFRTGGVAIKNLQTERVYGLNVEESITVEGFNNSRVSVDRENLELELTLAGSGEAEVVIGGKETVVVAGQPTMLELPGQPSVLRNAVDAFGLASLGLFGVWAYQRRRIRSPQDLADARGDELTVVDRRFT